MMCEKEAQCTGFNSSDFFLEIDFGTFTLVLWFKSALYHRLNFGNDYFSSGHLFLLSFDLLVFLLDQSQCYIAVGTSHIYGEDVTCKGRVRITKKT